MLIHVVFLYSKKANKKSLDKQDFLAGIAGFEPTDDGVRVRSLTVWRYPYVTNECDYTTKFLKLQELF